MNNNLNEINVSSLSKSSLVCERCLNNKPNFTCPNYLNCQYQRKYKSNVVIHDYGDKKEYLIFKDAFWQRGTTEVNTEVDRTRKFMYDGDGVLVPKDNQSFDNSIFAILNRLSDSRKRSLQNMYSFVNANDWSYWITLTIENKGNVNKYDDDQVKYLWQLFRQKLQRYFNDIGLLVIPEYHKKGGIHFHGLVAYANLDRYLTLAVNSQVDYKGKENKYYLDFLKTEFGDQIYNLDPCLYDFGFVTIVKIKDNNNFKLANYMSKYMTKDCCVKYNKKTYFRTHNLKCGSTQCSFLTDDEKELILNEASLLNTIRVKETDKLYSIFVEVDKK